MRHFVVMSAFVELDRGRSLGRARRTFRHTLPAGLPAGSYRFRVGVEWPVGEDRAELTSGAVEVR